MRSVLCTAGGDVDAALGGSDEDAAEVMTVRRMMTDHPLILPTPRGAGPGISGRARKRPISTGQSTVPRGTPSTPGTLPETPIQNQKVPEPRHHHGAHRPSMTPDQHPVRETSRVET